MLDVIHTLGQAWTKILCSNSLHQSVISFIWVEPTIELEIILSDLSVVLRQLFIISLVLSYVNFIILIELLITKELILVWTSFT
jgi:hypothetical protein